MNDNTKLGLLNIGTAAEYLGISIDTLRRWERKGRINPLRSPGGHRYYSKEDLDALFGKRYTRDEETIRRTNEQLGKNDFFPQQTSPLPTDLSSATLAKEEAWVKRVFPAETSFITKDTIQPYEPPVSVPPVSPVAEKPPDASGFFHPIDAQPAAKETLTTDRISDAVKETPQTSFPAIKNPSISESSINQTSANFETTGYSVSNILLPQKENKALQSNDWDTSFSALHREQYPSEVGITSHSSLDSRSDISPKEGGTLSEEEIEKRINTIIKKQEKSNFSSILLGTATFFMFAADVFLLYIWFTSFRIMSPIP
jgi:excisionase family DNA binding protein